MSDPRGHAVRTVRVGLAAALAIALSLLLDRWAFDVLYYPAVHENDLGRLLRSVGSLGFWALLATAVWLERRAGTDPRRRGAALLLLAPVASGAVAEVLKLLLRRERPVPHGGDWVFRSFAERPFSTSGLALPSSHVMVAFAGAVILARIFPRAAPVAYLLAAGCGLTRLLSHGHFLSDVAVGAVAGWAIGALVWHRFGRQRPSGIIGAVSGERSAVSGERSAVSGER